ncbi:ATP phosphoribosyltransferase regulatory subunit [Pontibacter sp. JAM-7]|uniref:ATP phosphoribosyltransferase regulatory subunit n=1 Tax=Pontibacter sp. JAM-7 TaxID=3366581 RepID=UPI003AF43A86
MALADRWLLPEGIKELLPPKAYGVELLRRRLLDLHVSWGYELVMPPLVEHLDSLLTGVGRDLDLNTIKVTDQLSGHSLGVRADITPQVARIDAHRLRQEGVTRLCYCGTVVHARPAQPLASRNPLQIGAELYGHAGIESDVEIIGLMMQTLQSAGVQQELTLDLGHVGVFRGLLGWTGLAATQQEEYQDILRRKALPELQAYVDGLALDAVKSQALLALPQLNGGSEVLQKALTVFAEAPVEVIEAIDYLQQLAARIALREPSLDLYFDLSELRGYNYHTGVVFAAYTPAFGQSIASGGRYDHIGSDFGRARPATGFSADLSTLAELSNASFAGSRRILAPALEDAALLQQVSLLRQQGETVIFALTGVAPSTPCTAELVQQEGQWQVVDL